MEIDGLRDAIEFFLLHLDRLHPQDKGMAMTVLIGEGTGVLPEAAIDEICEKPATVRAPDFYDDSGRPRLRIKTIVQMTGLNHEYFLRELEGGLNENFVDALDFISLNKENFVKGNGDKRVFQSAHAAIIDYGPPKVLQAFREKFREVFGQIPFDYIDENGEEYITTETLARFMGVAVEEVKESAEEAVKLGHAKTVTIPPDPEDGTVH